MGGHYINKQLIEISTSRSTCLELKENILPFISHTLSISRSVWDLFLVCSCWSRLFWRASFILFWTLFLCLMPRSWCSILCNNDYKFCNTSSLKRESTLPLCCHQTNICKFHRTDEVAISSTLSSRCNSEMQRQLAESRIFYSRRNWKWKTRRRFI
jgi:hypothetical protein